MVGGLCVGGGGGGSYEERKGEERNQGYRNDASIGSRIKAEP